MTSFVEALLRQVLQIRGLPQTTTEAPPTSPPTRIGKLREFHSKLIRDVSFLPYKWNDNLAKFETVSDKSYLSRSTLLTILYLICIFFTSLIFLVEDESTEKNSKSSSLLQFKLQAFFACIAFVVISAENYFNRKLCQNFVIFLNEVFSFNQVKLNKKAGKGTANYSKGNIIFNWSASSQIQPST